MNLALTGKYSQRSSRLEFDPSKHPLGERAIQSACPEHAELIRRHMVENVLEPGSCNVIVTRAEFLSLDVCPPLFRESPTLLYAASQNPEWRPLLNRREGYHYYRGTATANSVTIDVLIRRPVVPQRPDDQKQCVELFASVNLQAAFQLEDDAPVTIEVHCAPLLATSTTTT